MLNKMLITHKGNELFSQAITFTQIASNLDSRELRYLTVLLNGEKKIKYCKKLIDIKFSILIK